MTTHARGVEKTFLGNVKVRTKILGGSGIILTALVIVGGLSYFAFSNVAHDFEEYSDAAALANLGKDVEAGFAELNNEAKEFLLTEDPAVLAKADALMKEMLGSLDEAKSLAHHEEELKEIAEVVAKVGAFSEELRKVGELTLEETTQIDQIILPHGAKLMADAEELSLKSAREGNSNALVLAQTAEIALARGQGALATVLGLDKKEAMLTFESSFHELEQAIAGLDKATQGTDLRPVFEEFARLAKEYHAAAETAVEDHEERLTLVEKDMAATTTEAGTIIDALEEDVSRDEEELHSALTRTIEVTELTIAAISLVGLGLGVLVSMLIASGIAKPVIMMSGVMKALGEGNRTIEVPARGNKDEIGEMARSVEVFKAGLIEAERLRAVQEQEQQRQIERGRQMELAVADFDKLIGEVVGVVSSAATELQATAQTLSSSAEETARQSNVVSAASEETTRNVQTVASATEELSSSIHEISNQVTESTRIVGSAVSQAEDTNDKVNALAEAAQRIGAVVTLINEIASQTNLLALNATIEAARAGEAGRGFAIVASEVKNLASQTAKATEEIADQVKAIQDSSNSSAGAIKGITQTIARVNEISTAIASAVEEQSAATQEISRSVQQAAIGSAEVAANIVGVTDASHQTSAGSTQVLTAASELAANGERLRKEVTGFLHKVRSI
jgi:methyl-accepting chemotaxis protein/CHASE3 domain sensor protein